MANEELDDAQFIALKAGTLIEEREPLIEESIILIGTGAQATSIEINSVSIVETTAEGVASLESLEIDKTRRPTQVVRASRGGRLRGHPGPSVRAYFPNLLRPEVEHVSNRDPLIAMI